ncbi:FAD-dependent oxidoreductase [Mycolicibacterium sp. J2]|uniref:FAD-dependent oxidoreductase n=1 Tax=Mycolicibacterium sp. J2 TaxID=2993511 RepID=UPI00224AC0F5|nr:FAD-dependent oxidoreductase [Mycolicibacterium sp. J2]MCX2713636.1 FAD-dependent oxidoreductase [Mycolicibacterium sp. J2]
MAYVITRSCCSDALCAAVCPVDCIHPTPTDPDFGHTEMLYIDPARCIDCAACADVCPVDAIFADDELPSTEATYAAINAGYFSTAAAPPASSTLPGPPVRTSEALTVAVVGAGPSGFYAAAELLDAGPEVTVTLIDRLPTPYGLVRTGVAPDHQDTKRITTIFAATAAHPRLDAHFNVEVGTDVNHDELLAHHHAVVYATGAPVGRRLGVPGEHLPGTFTAAEIVGWYNGHPDHADLTVTAGHPTAVLVGNGNVALDVARVLLLGGRMGHTDIADHARETLQDSGIREVIILGRRGPEHAAFSFSQLLALAQLDGVDVVVDPAELADAVTPVGRPHPAAFAGAKKLALLHELSVRAPQHDRRIHLRFSAALRAVSGTERVQTVTVASSEGSESVMAAGIVVSCIGFDARPIDGLAFDADSQRVPNHGGRVLDGAGRVVTGHYVTGWAKRGPSGVIGTNKLCAAETVAALLDDHRRGLLRPPRELPQTLAARLDDRSIDRIDRGGWLRIDEHERSIGSASGRPRRKSVRREEMIEIAYPDEEFVAGSRPVYQPRRNA